jgi:RNA-directed DNA polymerase
MLDDLDKELESREHVFARYADDFVILVSTLRAARRAMTSIQRFVEKKLKLVVNAEKSKVVRARKLEFLGFTFSRKKISCSEKTIQKFRHMVKHFTKRNWGVSIEYRIAALSRYLRGWINYFRTSNRYLDFEEVDQWIRRRLRACIWKQWRHTRTKIRELRKRGVSMKQAVSTGASNKSYWRLSKTLATHWGMGNQWFEDLGLVNIRQTWVNFHYPNGYN